MENTSQLLTMNNSYYAQLDEQFKERVYNILFDDPSNHDDNEALQLIQQLVTNERLHQTRV